MIKSILKVNQFDLVLGAHPERAFPLLDVGKNRNDIRSETGLTLASHQVNLEVMEGEILVLMGLSGSGKSSLLRSINGLNGKGKDQATRGEILYLKDNEFVSILSMSDEQLRKIRQEDMSMVFQQFGLLPWYNVHENVGFGLELKGVPLHTRKGLIDEYLHLVGLEKWAFEYPDKLSGGMKQRVGLARALCMKPKVLLLDEPFSALDPVIRVELQKELLELKKKFNQTIIFVTHDFEEAMTLGDRIGILEEGKLLQTDEPDNIIRRPNGPTVQRFVKSAYRDIPA